jgi:hypothetical protein
MAGEGVLQDAGHIAAGETRAASVVINFVDNPNAAYLGISSLAGFSLDFSIVDDAWGNQRQASWRIRFSAGCGDSCFLPAENASLSMKTTASRSIFRASTDRFSTRVRFFIRNLPPSG